MIDVITGYPINWRDPRGYVRLQVGTEHPLSNRKGIAPRHRVVCWEALGRPTSSECFTCGYRLPWSGFSGYGAYRLVVNVDHIDAVPGHDDPSNLRPACWWCNANRGWAVDEVGAAGWLDLIRPYVDDHPSERPNLPLVFEARYGRPPARFAA